MVDHAPWIGSHYDKSGMREQRVAIVGYSHWLEQVWQDTDRATIDCISKVVSGRLETKTTFFDRVRNCFGYDNHNDFWPKVMFFEFLPDCVGGGNDRYKHGTPAQRERAVPRFLRLITNHQPNKVLIFTGFNTRSRYFPPMDSKPESIQQFPMFKWGRTRLVTIRRQLSSCDILSVPARKTWNGCGWRSSIFSICQTSKKRSPQVAQTLSLYVCAPRTRATSLSPRPIRGRFWFLNGGTGTLACAFCTGGIRLGHRQESVAVVPVLLRITVGAK